jgi:hypothetical protein
MSKPINKTSSPELDRLKAQFEDWRASRVGKQRIPQQLLEETATLLKTHSMAAVSRVSLLDYRRLKQLAQADNLSRKNLSSPSFLEIKPEQIAASGSKPTLRPISPISASSADPICTIVFERIDGSRLTVSIPADGRQLANLCASLLRA